MPYTSYVHIRLSKIPHHCILKRWRKDSATIQHSDFKYSDDPSINSSPEGASLISTIWREMRLLVSSANQDIESQQSVLESIKRTKDDLHIPIVPDHQSTKDDYFHRVLGVSQPTDLHIKTPRIAGNKGCGRMKSMREIEVQKSKKPKRLCRYCNEYGYHDKRNCPKKEEEKKSGGAQKDAVQTDTADDVYNDDFGDD
ncbi:hypothetical protein QQ045_021609 [Rhodiola kirilowii]